MNSQLKSLTWKYFWQQKWQELRLPLLFVIIGIGLIFLNISICNANGVFYSPETICSVEQLAETNTVCGIEAITLNILMMILFLMMEGLIFAGIFFGGRKLVEWLQDNWEKASKRAKQNLERKKNL